MPFFIRKKTTTKRSIGKKPGKKEKGGSKDEPKAKKKKLIAESEEILSESESENEEDSPSKTKIEGLESDEEETIQEKKVRLAKEYLAHLKKLEEERAEEEDEDAIGQRISHRLHQEVLEKSGRVQKFYGDILQGPAGEEDMSSLKGLKASVTCAVISSDEKWVFAACKNGSLMKWEVATQKRLHTIPFSKKPAPGTDSSIGGNVGHKSQVLCLAITSDGEFLASGDLSGQIHVWRPSTCEHLGVLRGHKQSVTGLTMRKGTHQLYSCSADKSVRVWGLDEMAYADTFFGHTDAITDIHCMNKERAITSGGRDGSVRVWKIADESHLIFLGHLGSQDCVAFITDDFFVSGGDEGSVSLWTVKKKKPLFTCRKAHAHWVSAVAALPNSDIIASGSNDGAIKIWRCSSQFKSLEFLFSVPQVGFINSLRFTRTGPTLVAAVGKEHRLGRWDVVKEAKNIVTVIKLHLKEQEEDMET